MKKGFRLIALMLTITMCLALFAGCKKETTSGGIEKLGLVVWNTQGTDYTPEPLAKGHLLKDWLEEKTGVFIEDIYGNGGSQWDPKLTKIIASGNIPDIVLCSAGQGGAHFQKLDQLGKLVKFTPEMLKKYAPNLWEKTPASYWSALTNEDGQILGIPYNAPPSIDVISGATEEDMEFIANSSLQFENDVMYLKDACFWVRDDILKDIYPDARSYDELVALMEERNEPIGDELLDIPVYSTDDFVDFFYKIRDNKYTSNGTPVYAFGYTGGDNWVGLNWFGADMIGYKGHNYSATWNAKEQKIEIPLMHEAVKEAGRIQNQMVADKVIDPESLVNTAALYKEKAMNGNYAVVVGSFLGTMNAINDELEKSGVDFRFRPFITQVPALEQYPAYKEEALWNSAFAITNTLTEEEVIKVLKWADIQYTTEYEKAYYWGPEEAGLYEETEDGKLIFKDKKYNDYFIDDTIDLEKDDRQGLGLPTSYLNLRPTSVSVWDARVMHRKLIYYPNTSSGFKFPYDSEHVTSVALHPASQIWDARYASLPEVISFWNERSKWESKFTMALAAEPKDFEKKWQEAVDTVNAIVKVEDLEAAMTKVAKPLAEEIANRAE